MFDPNPVVSAGDWRSRTRQVVDAQIEKGYRAYARHSKWNFKRLTHLAEEKYHGLLVIKGKLHI